MLYSSIYYRTDQDARKYFRREKKKKIYFFKINNINKECATFNKEVLSIFLLG